MGHTFRHVNRKWVGGNSRRLSKTRSSSLRLRTLKQKYDTQKKSMLAIFKRKELNDLKAAINKLEKSKSKSKEVGALKKIYNMISSNPGTTFGTGVALLVSTLVANGDIRFQDLNSITDLVKLKKKKNTGLWMLRNFMLNLKLKWKNLKKNEWKERESV